MKHTDIPEKVQQAITCLQQGIDSGIFTKGEILPPVSRLAQMAGVSLVTMCKAQAVLKANNVLSGRRGQATRVTGGTKPEIGTAGPVDSGALPVTALTREEPFRRIYRHIRKDILFGVYEPSARLPLVKQLKSRYRVAGVTLRKALALLCEEELVVPASRFYAVARLSAQGSGQRIGVIMQKESIANYDLGNAAGHNYLREIELHASRIPLGISLAAFDWEGDGWGVASSHGVLPGDKGDVSTIAGYIVAISTSPQQYTGLCRRLAQARRSVSFLDQLGDWIPPPPFDRSLSYVVFPVGVTPQPGRRIANYLLSLGHRRAAYFSLWHDAPWSTFRYQGIRDAFTESEPGDGQSVQLHAMISGDWFDATVVDRSTIPDLTALPNSMKVFDNLGMHSQMRRQLQPMFEKALATSGLTAWIAANDQIAVYALDFLRQRGIEVPGRISVAAFDDSTMAMTHRITSYNFNLQGIVAAAFRHALQTGPHAHARRPRTVEVPGNIVERQSTGPARRSSAR